MADVVDQQELNTGLRQEGVFFSALSFSNKSVGSLGIIFGGLIIDFLGFSKGITPDMVDPHNITRLGITIGIILPIIFVIPVCLFLFFNLSRKKHEEILVELNRRHGKKIN